MGIFNSAANQKKIDDLQTKVKELESKLKTEEEEITVRKLPKEPYKKLLIWSAPSRVFIRRERAWFVKIAAIAILAIIIAALFKDILVIILICVLVLITYLLAIIPPEKVKHEITTRGIKTVGTLYKWSDLKDFWISIKYNKKVLYVTTKMNFPHRLTLLLDQITDKEIIQLLSKYIDYKDFEGKQGWLSTLNDGVNIPIERYRSTFYKSDTAKYIPGKTKEKDSRKGKLI